MSVKNFPGPYEVEFLYSTTLSGRTITRKQRLNCDLQSDPAVGTPWSGINVAMRSGAFAALDVKFDEYLNLLAPVFSAAATSFDGANLYKYNPNSFVKNFRASYNTAVVPTSVGAAASAGQQSLTFGTQEGGNMMLTFLESAETFLGIDKIPLALANWNAIMTYVIGTTNWIMARDTSYPVQFKSQLGGQNEKAFRQRWR